MRTDFQKSVDRLVSRWPTALCFKDPRVLLPSTSTKSRSSSFLTKTEVSSENCSNCRELIGAIVGHLSSASEDMKSSGNFHLGTEEIDGTNRLVPKQVSNRLSTAKMVELNRFAIR